MKKRTHLILDALPVRKHVFCSTVFSAKFFLLFSAASSVCKDSPNLSRLCVDVVAEANRLHSESLEDAAAASGLSQDAFRRADALFDDENNRLIVASIRRKIAIWEDCLAKALESDVSAEMQAEDSEEPEPDEPCVLFLEDVVLDLLDLADEIEAWLDVEFAEEYDDFREENQGFDDFVRLLAIVRLLAELVENVK